jgi:hypothetical protein
VTAKAKLAKPPDIDAMSGRIFLQCRTWFEPAKSKKGQLQLKLDNGNITVQPARGREEKKKLQSRRN